MLFQQWNVTTECLCFELSLFVFLFSQFGQRLYQGMLLVDLDHFTCPYQWQRLALA